MFAQQEFHQVAGSGLAVDLLDEVKGEAHQGR
jgi:hypothetical protein